MEREKVDLCGVWKILPDPRVEAELGVCRGHSPDTRRWREALIPATFEGCLPDLEGYEGAVWFAREVAVPPGWTDRRVALRFEGVNHHCKVWVNGHEAGGNDDGFLPFELEVTGLAREGAPARILVRVDNLRREPDLPGTFMGWRNQGGILREVSLAATNPTHLAEVKVNAGSGGDLSVSWMVANGVDRPRTCLVLLRVLDAAGAPVCEARSETAVVPGGSAGPQAVSVGVADPAAWSPKTPSLYRAQLRLVADGEEVDGAEVRFGFRTVQVSEGRLLLNGEPLHLQGWNRHEDSPRHGMARDLETARADLLAMKEAGANFVRLCHYPHHPGELDLCDEIGLAVMTEIPLYGWAGSEEPAGASAKLVSASRQLERMIRRDGNHPSVIFWSVSNETEEARPEVVRTNRALVRLARQLDPSRLAVHVSNHWQAHPHFEEDDVICTNGYPSVDGPTRIRGCDGIETAADVWRRDLDTLHAASPAKPVLVTEFGFQSVSGAVGEGMMLDQQARVIEAEMAVFREKPYLCGATIWCWADHLWPVGVFDQGLGISPWGVLTRSRHPLPAFATASRLFRERADREACRGQSASAAPPASEGPGGYEVLMVRHHLRDIPRVALPAGYTMRPLGPGDAGLWTDVQRDAEEYYTVDDGLFEREFGGDLTALAWRSFVALDERKLSAGVISAWRWPEFRDGLWGQIHWVAVRRSYQGRGIGKGMLSFALERLAQWHDKAMLETGSKRLPAISLYLSFGFEPDLDLPGALEVWRGVARELPHPALEKLRS